MDDHRITLPEYSTAPPTGKSAWAWFRFFLKPNQAEYNFCLLFNLIRQTFFRSQPFFLGILVGWVESGSLAENPMLAVIWMAIYAVTSFLAYCSIIYLLPKAGIVMDKLSKHVSLYGFQHYLNLSESWHENRASGEKLQRLLKARDTSFVLLENILWHLIQFPAIALSVFLSVIILDAGWYYIILFYAMISSYIWIAHSTGSWLKSRFEDFYKTQEQVVGGVYEFLTSTSTVRFFNLKRHILEKAGHYETINHESRTRLFKTSARRWFALDCTALFWILSIIGLSTYEVMHDGMSITAYTAIIFTTVSIWFEIEVFAILYAAMVDQWEGFKRLTEILNQEPTIKDRADAKDLQTRSASLSFENVRFEYQSEANVLQDLSLHINAGEKIGLIGPSGAGKSTLIKLIMRFYDVDSGTVNIDGQNIQSLTQHSIQHHIAVIPQDIVLFNHSLMENIRYGRLDASDSDVINAAKRAHAFDFIEKLPDGFGTIVGERGVKLSGGQRQRIAIARAILKDAPILILDEATSALDSESEKLLQSSLEELMQGKTVIAVAHRLSTIHKMDRLIVMDQGRIIEDGSHDKLMSDENGLYNKLWTMQSGGFL